MHWKNIPPPHSSKQRISITRTRHVTAHNTHCHAALQRRKKQRNSDTDECIQTCTIVLTRANRMRNAAAHTSKRPALWAPAHSVATQSAAAAQPPQSSAGVLAVSLARSTRLPPAAAPCLPPHAPPLPAQCAAGAPAGVFLKRGCPIEARSRFQLLPVVCARAAAVPAAAQCVGVPSSKHWLLAAGPQLPHTQPPPCSAGPRLTTRVDAPRRLRDD